MYHWYPNMIYNPVLFPPVPSTCRTDWDDILIYTRTRPHVHIFLGEFVVRVESKFGWNLTQVLCYYTPY